MSRSALSCTLVVAAIAAVTLLGPGQSAIAFNAGMLLPGDPRVANLLAAEQALVDLTNADRASHGLDPLAVDPDTLWIARERAENQLGTPALSHYDANGDLVFARLLGDAGLKYQLAGENLARASAFDPDIVERVEDALMRSPTHRKNILERTFHRLAIGAAVGQGGQISFAEVYRD
jgi:uncharacterized protein YkwD